MAAPEELPAAALRWAHHWGALADLIGALVVAGIAAAAGAGSGRRLRRRLRGIRRGEPEPWDG
jgi:hypothetical protein